jgi:hypothetical protein
LRTYRCAAERSEELSRQAPGTGGSRNACPTERKELVDEPDAGIQLRVPGRALLETGQADEHQSDVATIAHVALLLEPSGLETICDSWLALHLSRREGITSAQQSGEPTPHGQRRRTVSGLVAAGLRAGTLVGLAIMRCAFGRSRLAGIQRPHSRTWHPCRRHRLAPCRVLHGELDSRKWRSPPLPVALPNSRWPTAQVGLLLKVPGPATGQVPASVRAQGLPEPSVDARARPGVQRQRLRGGARFGVGYWPPPVSQSFQCVGRPACGGTHVGHRRVKTVTHPSVSHRSWRLHSDRVLVEVIVHRRRVVASSFSV